MARKYANREQSFGFQSFLAHNNSESSLFEVASSVQWTLAHLEPSIEET